MRNLQNLERALKEFEKLGTHAALIRERWLSPLKNGYTKDEDYDITKLASELRELQEIIEESLREMRELAIFRLVQEALSNIRKHANAQNLRVTLDYTESALRIAIEDDGIGFDLEEAPNEARESGHFGILNMEERVRLLHGNLQIDTASGRGTRLLVTIPWEVSTATPPGTRDAQQVQAQNVRLAKPLKLSKREEEVLDLIVKGGSNSDIAKTLCISEKTVKNHVSNILRKFGVRRRVEAAVYALEAREGLLLR